MANLIRNLPKVPYRDTIMSNLMTSAILVKKAIDKFDVYHDYIIKEGERADTIAYDYYDDSQMDWLIYITNGIYDPYRGWPLTSRQLLDFIVKKYGSIEEAQNPVYYKFTGVAGENELDISNKTYIMTLETFNRLSSVERAGWVPVTGFDHEQDENNAKSNIKLLSNRYTSQVNEELLRLFR